MAPTPHCEPSSLCIESIPSRTLFQGAKMCGIIGYVGNRPCREMLLDGLRRLEYRGYDSAGLAWRDGDDAVQCVRAIGNLDSLEAAMACTPAGAVTALASLP